MKLSTYQEHNLQNVVRQIYDSSLAVVRQHLARMQLLLVRPKTIVFGSTYVLRMVFYFFCQREIFARSTAIPPALGETSPVKFDPVTLEISMLNHTHLKRIFRKNIFQSLGGAAPPNLYTR